MPRVLESQLQVYFPASNKEKSLRLTCVSNFLACMLKCKTFSRVFILIINFIAEQAVKIGSITIFPPLGNARRKAKITF